MNRLYPLKFQPVIKDKIWGGRKLNSVLGKDTDTDNAGESWELSGVEGDISVVSNGFLAGNNLQELIEVYMGDLIGDRIFEKYGIEFPLLIKFIDATDDLSIQVHPDDELAGKRHNSFGKTEMWYVIQADENAEIITGFKQDVDKEIYKKNLENKTLDKILNIEKVKKGDVFFLPAGRVHAIGKGILLAEIQQTSDITYRIYDYDRKDHKGNKRELHTELALDAIDYNYYENYKTEYNSVLNKTSEIIKCDYFTTCFLEFDKSICKDFQLTDSFIIYICLEGSFDIRFYEEDIIHVKKGETILVPAEIKMIDLIAKERSKVLEVYIP